MVVESSSHHVVVVGAGMVAHRFVESLLSRAGTDWHVTLIGEEGHDPYDRVGLTRCLSGTPYDELTLDRTVLDDPRVTFLSRDPVTRIDRATRAVATARGRIIGYDR